MKETLPTDSFPIESFMTIRSFLALAKEATLIINPQFRISYINPKAKELFHTLNGSVHSEEGTHFFDLIPSACKPLLEEKLLQCLKGQPHTYHIEVIAKQGQALWIHYQLTPITAEEGVKGIYVTLQDITQQKELEKEEQKRKTAEDQAKNLFELFMEHAPLRAWITDKEGIVHYMNNSYKRALNIPATEATKSLFELFPKPWAEEYLSDLQKVLKTNEPLTTVSKGKRANGADGIFKFTRFPLTVWGETMVAGWAIDITEHEELQKKLIDAEKNKKRSIIRSIIETQEKERRALSVELHDNVNQILSSCQLMLEAARENTEAATFLTEKCHHSLKTAISEIRKISHELNPSAIADIGLSDAITDMIEKINSSGKIRMHFILKDFDESILNMTDKVAIYRIIQEQLNNVLKHARAKQVFIDLHSRGDKLFLKIEDDGVGFHPEKIKKGIGLRNIQHRIEYYQGKFKIDTAPGKGCRLLIALAIPERNKKERNPE